MLVRKHNKKQTYTAMFACKKKKESIKLKTFRKNFYEFLLPPLFAMFANQQEHLIVLSLQILKPLTLLVLS